MSLFRKLFGTGDNPPDATKLDGTSEAALTRSLAALPPGERGWITFAEASTLFSTEGGEYAFGEMDKDSRRNIESFAAQHGSVINFMPNEQRVYFVRSHWGGWRQPGIPL
jgi:hypothetical protein